MSWLLSYTLGSMAAAFVVVKIFDYLVSGAADSAHNAARGTVFITAWSAVTARSGMRGLTKSVRKFRKGNTVAKNGLDALTKRR